jgi:hypothetical protein
VRLRVSCPLDTHLYLRFDIAWPIFALDRVEADHIFKARSGSRQLFWQSQQFADTPIGENELEIGVKGADSNIEMVEAGTDLLGGIAVSVTLPD